MTVLDCNVINCVYNADNSCKRSDITVGGEDARKNSETCCESFVSRECDCTANNAACNCKKDTEVSCKAQECVYNRSKACTAGSIDIAGGMRADDSRQTCCGSFMCG